MLKVQEYLRHLTWPQITGGPGLTTIEALAKLTADYAIKVTRHTAHPELTLLKYDQIDSPFKEPLVQECRGLILCEGYGLPHSPPWSVVAMPYTKFFNHGEALAHPIDWNTAKVYEKLDGSLITLYRYKDAWHVSTSGVPDGTNAVGDFGLTFAELFWKTWAVEGYDLEWLDYRNSYMFELCAPQNRVVVRHAEPRLVLHGVRTINSMLQEHDVSFWAGKFKTPRSFPINSVDGCVEAAKHLQPLECEGYVVCDSGFNRLKIKSPAYVALHHAKDGLMVRSKMADIIRSGETAEFETALSAFPELADDFYALKTRYEALIEEAGRGFNVLKDIPDQKSFAIAAQQQFGDVKHFLFAMRKTPGLTPQTYMGNMLKEPYLRLVGVKS